MTAHIIYKDFLRVMLIWHLNCSEIEATSQTNSIWGHIRSCLSQERTPNMVKTSQKRSQRVTRRHIQSQHHTSFFSRRHDGSASASKAKHGSKRRRHDTHLAQGQHHEGPPAAGVHNHGHKLGVNGAEVAVPRHLGDPDVVVALVGFGGLAEDVAELTVPNKTPGHGGLGRDGNSRTMSAKSGKMTSKKESWKKDSEDFLLSSKAAWVDEPVKSSRFAVFQVEINQQTCREKPWKEEAKSVSQWLPLSVAAAAALRPLSFTRSFCPLKFCAKQRRLHTIGVKRSWWNCSGSSSARTPDELHKSSSYATESEANSKRTNPSYTPTCSGLGRSPPTKTWKPESQANVCTQG